MRATRGLRQNMTFERLVIFKRNVLRKNIFGLLYNNTEQERPKKGKTTTYTGYMGNQVYQLYRINQKNETAIWHEYGKSRKW